MDNYELSEYKDKCAYWLEAVKSCRLCLFNVLCNLERNTERNLHRNEWEWEKQYS